MGLGSNKKSTIPVTCSLRCNVINLELKGGGESMYFQVTFKYENGYLDHKVFYPKTVNDAKDVIKWLEHFLSAFISSEEMIELLGEDRDGFDGFVNSIIEKIHTTDYKNINLILKTIRKRNGYVTVPKFIPFVKREDDTTSPDLFYTDWEKRNNFDS